MKIAYITLATDERYLQGAYNLYKSYLKTKSKYPFYCAVLKTTNVNNFKDLPTITVPKIIPYNKSFDWKWHPPIGMFNKFALWTLEEFDYFLFLDSDVILYKNIDSMIDQNIDKINNNTVMMAHTPKNKIQNIHNRFFSGTILFKPNKNFLKNALKYINYSQNDEETITFMYDNNEINIINDVCFHQSTFHFSNWYHNQKYWENDLGKKIYNAILKNPEIATTIKEIQNVIFNHYE